jgi:hypothetical protein
MMIFRLYHMESGSPLVIDRRVNFLDEELLKTSSESQGL